MRDNVLVRKKAGIILMLAKALKVTPEKALGLFYPTNTNRLLSDKRFGIQLMSNHSLVRDILSELKAANGYQQSFFHGGHPAAKKNFHEEERTNIH